MRWSFDFHNINIPTSAHVLVRDIKQKNYDHDAHGDKVWNSCLALMDYLSEVDIKDLEVMDVGCGWGVLSSFLAKKGANVQSVDCDKSIQPYYQLIKELNNTSSMLRIADIASLEERDFANIDWDYLKKNKNIGLVPAAPLIVGSVGQLDSKTDSGWKDQLSRIAERHPESPLADRYGNKSHKALKTKSVLEKHRKRNKTK